MAVLPKLCSTIFDKLDHATVKFGLRNGASFDDFENRSPKILYAGRLSRHLPQFKSPALGMTPYFVSSRNISHDVMLPLPLPDNYIDIYQSEDVFEHIGKEYIVDIFNEIFRILKPGGLFRLSLPDYNYDEYIERSEYNEAGEIVFDPGGGGTLRGGSVVDGGHLWFPTYEMVRHMFERSRFLNEGSVEFLQYNLPNGDPVMNAIDFTDGYIQRVPGEDPRVKSNPRPISIVVDARKSMVVK